MSLFGRHFPPGTRYFPYQMDPCHERYVVRACLPGAEPSPTDPRVGPEFADFIEAARYAECRETGVAYTPPAGRAI